MNSARIYALVKRNLLITYRGLDPVYDIFYWPAYDLVLWGFASRGIESTGDSHLSLIWLGSLTLWQACVRSNLDMAIHFLIELWSNNVISMFATPLRFSEWVTAVMILGFINAFAVVLVGMLIAYLLYGVKILALGWLLVPLFLLLVHSGWIIGMVTTGILLYGGLKIQKIVWILGWFFAPFSALFYVLDVLPNWAYVVAKSIPTSYAIEGIRSYVSTGVFPVRLLTISFLLNGLYSVLAILFLMRMFKKSKERGLAQLENE